MRKTLIQNSHRKCDMCFHRGRTWLVVQETWVLSLGGKDALEKGMETHSCLENPMDRGAWQAAVLGVAKSWTWLNDSAQATWYTELTPCKGPWCWEGLRGGGEGVTVSGMVGWNHWISGHESEQTLGDSEGQGSLVCLWGCKELDTT